MKRVFRLLKLPLPLMASKILRKGLTPLQRRADCREAGRCLELFREGRVPAVPGVPGDLAQTELPCAFNPAAVQALPEERRRMVRHFAGEACGHRFDLLGSGPVRVGYHTQAPGLAGRRFEMTPGAGEEGAVLEMMERLLGLAGSGARRDEGREFLWERFRSYRPIDWHLDFRSGYRWNPARWRCDVPIGQTAGADVKVPWELSRFQHLGAMGLAFHLEEPPQADISAAEFVLQLTDWIVANPPCCGVNWNCSMEAAIRAVNWLWGLKLFARSPLLTPEFQRLVNWSLYHHAIFLRRNPENRDPFVGNHYLAGLAGQIHLEAACPWLPRNARCLAFAVGEFIKQVGRQFNADGSNFEASTGYHRLTTEILYETAPLLLQLEGERRERLAQEGRSGEADFTHPLIFPPWFWDRALGAAEYAAALLKPGGSFPQLGDFDNGRFHKLVLTASFDEVSGTYREEKRDIRPLLAVAGRLFGREDLAAAGALYGADAGLWTAAPVPGVREKPGKAVEARPAKRECAGVSPAGVTLPAAAPALRTLFYVEGCREEALRRAAEPGDLVRHVSPAYFPDAGTAVFDAPPFHLVISCSPGGASGWGVHSHNDLLSFELNARGEDFIVDPGTYVYTASVEERNYFRATAAHNTLLVPGKEQKRWLAGLEGLFSLPGSAGAQVLGTGPGFFCGEHRGYGSPHRRSFYIFDEAVVMEDEIEGENNIILSFNLAPGTAVRERGCGRYLLVKGEKALYMEVMSEGAPLRGHVQKSFYSPAYGQKLPALRLLVELAFQEAD